MKKIESLPKVSERFTSDVYSEMENNIYSSELANRLIADVMGSEGNKVKVFKDIFEKQKELIETNNTPFCIWVYTEGVSFQVLMAEPINPTDSDCSIYQLLFRDYRGGLDITYSMEESNKVDGIFQSVNTAIVDLNDVTNVQLPSTPSEIIEDIVGPHMTERVKTVNEFEKWFRGIAYELNILVFQRSFRQYFETFHQMEITLEEKYPKWIDEYDSLYNEYDRTCKRYYDTIKYIIGDLSGPDSVFSVYTNEAFQDVTPYMKEYERSFCEDEFNSMCLIAKQLKG